MSPATRSPFLAVAALVLVGAAVIFGQLPGSTLFWREIQNLAHAPAFLLIALALLRLWRKGSHSDPSDPRTLVAVLTAGLALGIAIEVVQAATGRDASLQDVITDLAGLATGLAAHEWWVRRRLPPPRIRHIAAGGVVIGVLIAVTPAALSARAYLHRTSQFPVLADFDSASEFYFIRTRNAGREVIREAGAEPFLLLRFDEGSYPGLDLIEPAPDWSGFHSLRVDIENPGDTPLELALRVHDRAHTRVHTDRFNTTFELAAQSRSQFSFPLEAIQSAPEGRVMDLSQIDGVILFAPQPQPGRELRVYRVWLE